MATASHTFRALALASAPLFLGLAGCQSMAGDHMGMGMDGGRPMGQPGIAYSGVKPTADNQSVLDAMMRLGAKPVHTLTPPEARLQPTFADGVKSVLADAGRPTAPPPGVTARDITVRGAAGNLHAKLYKPDGVSGRLPVIVYFHGGGWVIADSNVYDGGARALAREGRAIVISVDYRLAPEAKFPAQHDDALAAYRWARTNAASLGGDPAKMALAGESAGGNLAIATAQALRDAGEALPAAIVSVYPVAGTDVNTPSYQENANAKPLNRAGILWFVHHTTKGPADVMDPRLNLVMSNLAGLPPVTIVAAQIDPLRSEGAMLADKLRAAGVNVERREFTGATHEFFGADAVIAQARAAQAFAGTRLRAAFGN